MIAINKTLPELDRLAQEHLSVLKNSPFQIELRLNNASSSATSYETQFFMVIIKYWPEIITGRPDRLEQINEEIKRTYKSVLTSIKSNLPPAKANQLRIDFQTRIASIFDYSYFTSATNGKHAYTLAQKLDVSVCLYCNRQFTFTVYGPSGRTRPQFDHFLKKSDFPWLGLSFYNLVPSCYICNSSFKGRKLFSIRKHLHPFIEGMEGTLVFNTGVNSATYTSANADDFSIELIPVKGAPLKRITRAKENAKVFHLQELYNRHKDYAGEIIQKTQWYNEQRMKHMETEVGDGQLFSSKEEMWRIALGNYLTPANLGKRVLAKLTRDIAREFDLLKYIDDDRDA